MIIESTFAWKILYLGENMMCWFSQFCCRQTECVSLFFSITWYLEEFPKNPGISIHEKKTWKFWETEPGIWRLWWIKLLFICKKLLNAFIFKVFRGVRSRRAHGVQVTECKRGKKRLRQYPSRDDDKVYSNRRIISSFHVFLHLFKALKSKLSTFFKFLLANI